MNVINKNNKSKGALSINKADGKLKKRLKKIKRIIKKFEEENPNASKKEIFIFYKKTTKIISDLESRIK
jgi:hypothetical protein